MVPHESSNDGFAVMFFCFVNLK